MTKKDLIRIIFKLFCLYTLVLSVFTTFNSFTSMLYQDFEAAGLIWMVFAIGMIVLIYWLLIKYTDNVIRFFKIDNGLDDEIINFSGLTNKKIIKLGLIIIGGSSIAYHLPYFISDSYYGIKSIMAASELDIMNMYNNYNPYAWVEELIAIIFGYLILTNFNSIGNWLLKQNKNEEE